MPGIEVGNRASLVGAERRPEPASLAAGHYRAGVDRRQQAL